MKKHLLALLILSVATTTFAEQIPLQFSTGVDESAVAMKTRFIQEYSHPDAKQVSKNEFVEKYSAQYIALFKQKKNVNQAQFIKYEQDKLDAMIAKHREMSMKQAHVRFSIIDANKDQKITLNEYQNIGTKNFNTLDKNQDGLLNQDDLKLDQKEQVTHEGSKLKSPIGMPTPNTIQDYIEQYANGRDYLTYAQYLMEREKQFDLTDLNKDHVLDENEYIAEFSKRYEENIANAKAKQQAFAAARFNAIANSSKTINQDDVKKFAAQLFDYWDSDKQGSIQIQP